MIDFIYNGETGLSVRDKLNTGISQINTLWSGTYSGTQFGSGGGGGTVSGITSTLSGMTEMPLAIMYIPSTHNFSTSNWEILPYKGFSHSGEGFSYNSNSGEFTVNHEGWYRLNYYSVSYTASPSTRSVDSRIVVNDSQVSTVFRSTYNDREGVVGDNKLIYLTDGDRVHVEARDAGAPSITFTDPNGYLELSRFVSGESATSYASSSSTSEMVYVYNPEASGVDGAINTFRNVGFTGVITNVNGVYDTADRVLTIESDGIYFYEFQIRLTNFSSARYLLQTQRNGERIDCTDTYLSTSTPAPTIKNTFMLSCSSGDILESTLFAGTSSSFDIQIDSGQSYLRLHKM